MDDKEIEWLRRRMENIKSGDDFLNFQEEYNDIYFSREQINYWLDKIIELRKKLNKGPKMKLEKVKDKEGPRMRLVFNADDFPDICEHCGGVHG